MGLIEQLRGVVAAVRLEFAADPREAIFEVEVLEDGAALAVVGVTSEPAAAESLQRRVGRIDAERPVTLEVARLPDPAERRSHAICSSSIAPMLSGPFVADPQVSQTVLGHRLLVYREHSRWLQCRSVDGYFGWIHRGYVHRVDELEARRWEAGDDGELCTSLGARAVGPGGTVLARLPWGARVVRLDDGTVRLPDGTTAHVEGELVADSEREVRFPQRGESLVSTAERWQSAPYMWGGVTRAGVDCSGLVQVVHRTHGVQLPRDSDQQARVGHPVHPGHDFEELQAGDLLFFAEDEGRVSHVAISRGGPRIIHASLGNGGVGNNDLTGDSGFEAEMRRIFVCARRVLGED